MARTSNITFGQVAQIADAMKAAGNRPTARAVRERIGSGSMGTIHKLLQQWTGKGNTQEDDENDAAELPVHIQNALMDFIGTEIATACEPINEELQAAKEAANDIAQDNERMHLAFDDQSKDLMHCQHARATAEANLTLTREIAANHESEVFKLHAQVSSLLLDLDRAQRQIEMLASYAPDLAKAQKALAESETKRTDAERTAAVLTAQLDAETRNTNELRERLKTAESRTTSAEAESKQSDKHYQACAARLEAAAHEIESLRKVKPTPAPKPAKKAAPKAN